MNKLELVDHIATEAELTKVSAAAALEAVLEGIVRYSEERARKCGSSASAPSQCVSALPERDEILRPEKKLKSPRRKTRASSQARR